MVQLAVIAHQEKLDRSTKKSLQRALTDAGLADVPWTMVSKARKTTSATHETI